ncbi:MAG: ABC transporter substrate-binding protein [Candidatus Moranbacteria bacterium]|nr:ABC transporter substrate-binding protein [Candidatus Moranbacteria bacterium]
MRTRDKVLVAFFSGLGVVALLFWLSALYLVSTKTVPKAGGEYIEGIAAQPRYINPVLSQTSEADADLTQLIYSGLFGYDASGNLVKRMAADWSVSGDGKLYTVTLRPGIKWHDGEEVTADDVLYTTQVILDPSYKSPLRAIWQTVEVMTVDRYTVTFALKKPYFGFLENLVLGILPKHIWENIAPENFLLADYNLAPIGSGPYSFFDSEKDSSGNMLSYELRAWNDYFDGAPYISKIIFHFYPDEATLIDAYNRKEVLGINSVTPENLSRLEEHKSTRVYDINVPRIFAVFFNTTKNVALAHDEVRQALSYATDRSAIIEEVLSGKGQSAYSAFLPFMTGYAADLEKPTFDIGKANALLEDNGWKRGEDGVRSKNGDSLSIELTVPDWPELTRTADLLKTQWGEAGARISVNVLGAADLQQNAIRPREYEALLFGEAAMIDSDPYSFWHSSNKHDPGLNLALFDNKDADDILATLREELDPEKLREKYRAFQEILFAENPAVFLYSPTYLYVVNSTVKGIDVQSVDAAPFRLSNVKDWYISTQRVRK